MFCRSGNTGNVYAPPEWPALWPWSLMRLAIEQDMAGQ